MGYNLTTMEIPPPPKIHRKVLILQNPRLSVLTTAHNWIYYYIRVYY